MQKSKKRNLYEKLKKQKKNLTNGWQQSKMTRNDRRQEIFGDVSANITQ